MINKTTVATGKVAKCPLCYHSIPMPEKVKVSEVAQCPKCRKMLEVTSVIPLTLAKIR